MRFPEETSMKRLHPGLWIALVTATVTTSAMSATTPDYRRSPSTRAAGLPFSDSVAAAGLVFLNSQIGNRPGEGRVVDGGLEPELGQALRNVDAALADRGLTRADIVMCTIVLRELADWPKLNRLWAASFPADRLPARNVIGATPPLGGAVAVSCIAAAPR